MRGYTICYFIVTRLLGQYLFPLFSSKLLSISVNIQRILEPSRSIIVNPRAIPVKDDLICLEIVVCSIRKFFKRC